MVYALKFEENDKYNQLGRGDISNDFYKSSPVKLADTLTMSITSSLPLKPFTYLLALFPTAVFIIFAPFMLFYPSSRLFNLFRAFIDVFISSEAFALLYSRCFF